MDDDDLQIFIKKSNDTDKILENELKELLENNENNENNLIEDKDKDIENDLNSNINITLFYTK